MMMMMMMKMIMFMMKKKGEEDWGMENGDINAYISAIDDKYIQIPQSKNKCKHLKDGMIKQCRSRSRSRKLKNRTPGEAPFVHS